MLFNLYNHIYQASFLFLDEHDHKNASAPSSITEVTDTRKSSFIAGLAGALREERPVLMVPRPVQAEGGVQLLHLGDRHREPAGRPPRAPILLLPRRGPRGRRSGPAAAGRHRDGSPSAVRAPRPEGGRHRAQPGALQGGAEPDGDSVYTRRVEGYEEDAEQKSAAQDYGDGRRPPGGARRAVPRRVGRAAPVHQGDPDMVKPRLEDGSDGVRIGAGSAKESDRINSARSRRLLLDTMRAGFDRMASEMPDCADLRAKIEDQFKNNSHGIEFLIDNLMNGPRSWLRCLYKERKAEEYSVF
ncbi:uncharacterized protein K452DRAFT_312497 [Aplosporella prunicola CBS 121167]|uniref:Uncharacterized protein n=1 Tax=Aplosporella prunicola CBS 121167 TaxID=1176127 RepID=A0A6A6AZJ5_9PEZI|nr:uncharacterized protein K452DRAFT_312497 [Aplosporella prunicola CBS 121167]KAF2137339.1 hypothetical protein K452DRAFT_312497 [Aplosporella prunicola CBS 121167]